MAIFIPTLQSPLQRVASIAAEPLVSTQRYLPVREPSRRTLTSLEKTSLANGHALPSDVSSRFGRRLKELRLLRSMTQVDMAKKFGIDRSFISDVERGKKSISLPMLEVIAIGMNISLSKLFEEL